MQRGNVASCVCCGQPAGQTRALTFPFCGACFKSWEKSGERRRALELMTSNEHAALAAIEDFIRRIQAERRNGS